MAEGDEELQSYLDKLSDKVKRNLAYVINEQAEELAEAIREAAPAGETSNLKESVRVEPGRNELEKIVAAGGEKTTVHGYDYSLATEFGTSKENPQPFFWPTYRRKRDRIARAIQDAVAEALKG